MINHDNHEMNGIDSKAQLRRMNEYLLQFQPFRVNRLLKVWKNLMGRVHLSPYPSALLVRLSFELPYW